ncbi:MAG: hypothetical protein Q8O00_13070, partial [Holophaga sp.]|nr:hypothetical protein [Holophaga sp.]
MGRRGEIAQKQGSPAAIRRLLLCVVLLSPALGLAWIGATLHQAQALIPAVVFGAGIFGLFLAGREHSAAGELLAAAAFSLSALPVAVLGGISTEKALTLALGLMALHALGTTLVRGFLASLMQGKIRGPKILPVLLGLALSVGVLVSPLPWLLALAPVPLTLAALWVLWRPPSPRDLRTVGWVLTAGSLVGALTILAGLHGFQRF